MYMGDFVDSSSSLICLESLILCLFDIHLVAEILNLWNEN